MRDNQMILLTKLEKDSLVKYVIHNTHKSDFLNYTAKMKEALA